jgi:hypothetical protein
VDGASQEPPPEDLDGRPDQTDDHSSQKGQDRDLKAQNSTLQKIGNILPD